MQNVKLRTDDRLNKTVLVMECVKCHHKWKPSPARWRNKLDEGGRMMKCQKCGATNNIDEHCVKLILRHNDGT